MTHKSELDRRQFVGLSAATAAAGIVGTMGPFSRGQVQAATVQKAKHPICCFAKPLQHLSYDKAAERVAELGFDGVEGTIRKNGQVEPERVETDLPKYVKALQKQGLDCTIMASDINSVDQPATKRVLQTAADLGIKRYRMKYYKYDLKKPIAQQLQEMKPVLAKLAELNRKLGMTAVYQNHAGETYVGASIWDLYYLVRDISPDEVALAYDIRHATAEAGNSWPVNFSLVKDHLGAVYVKDFHWVGSKMQNVPLGTGIVKKRFFSMLSETKFAGPISLHMEYVDHRDPALVEQSLAAIKNDMAVLQKLLQLGH